MDGTSWERWILDTKWCFEEVGELIEDVWKIPCVGSPIYIESDGGTGDYLKRGKSEGQHTHEYDHPLS